MLVLVFQLIKSRCHSDLRKYRFTVRVVNSWNSLPEHIISSATTNTSKKRLDKFWSSQNMVYYYKSDITGIGNRSSSSLDGT